jgi:hypothetical protein
MMLRMGAIKPWHVAALGCCCLVVTAVIAAVVFYVVQRGRGKSGQGGS